jgi:hypothetical protein
MRTEGRIIKAGCQPLKTVKARAATVNKLRELEVRKDELMDAGYSAESVEVMQGLYSRSQTEVYVPPPVVDVSAVEAVEGWERGLIRNEATGQDTQE